MCNYIILTLCVSHGQIMSRISLFEGELMTGNGYPWKNAFKIYFMHEIMAHSFLSSLYLEFEHQKMSTASQDAQRRSWWLITRLSRHGPRVCCLLSFKKHINIISQRNPCWLEMEFYPCLPPSSFPLSEDQ